jgi:hypothetical protein
MRTKILIPTVIILLLICGLAYFAFAWTVNRVYVAEGQSLQLRYKGPLIFGSRQMAKQGYWAEEGEIGIRKELRGPGRHFYCPIWWQRELVDDVVILPGQCGIVTCKLGDPLEGGAFLVDGDIGDTKHKGILRKALGPGRYRINPYGYTVKIVGTEQRQSGKQVKYSGWVEIPTGYVGVVTNLSDNPLTGATKGIQENVLPPGIYPINTKEQQIDIVEIGFRESTIVVQLQKNEDGSFKLDEQGEPIVANAQSGIGFPSSDGFQISEDFTAIWGLMPEQAPHAVETFGNVAEVEQKVVLPQIESICRNNGSTYEAVQLLVGAEREIYQQDTLEEFQKVLAEKDITLLYGLVRHIYIPQEVRQPIQLAFIAEELTLTRVQEQETAKAKALLQEATKQVDLATETVTVDTERQYQARLAAGNREAGRIDAETKKLTAVIEKETAALNAAATRVLGEATHKGEQMVEEAKADRFRLAVEAFGTPGAYNNYIFAEGMPEDVDLKLLYAGDGTLWTDYDNFGIRATIPVPKSEDPHFKPPVEKPAAPQPKPSPPTPEKKPAVPTTQP